MHTEADAWPCTRAREPALFTGTIRDNIAGWRDVSDEEVAAAAAAANAAGFIARAPDGYATLVLCWSKLRCMPLEGKAVTISMWACYCTHEMSVQAVFSKFDQRFSARLRQR